MCFVRVFLAVQDAELIGNCMITATGHVLASFLDNRGKKCALSVSL